MLSVLVAANVADGHVAPMLGVAEQFARSGHRVRFLCGDRFADAVRRTGAEFIPWPADAQVDHQAVIAEMSANGGPPRGARALARSVDQIFIAPAPGQYRALQQATDAEHTDVVLTENTVVGAAALALSGRPHPPVVACGILPLGLTSVDTAPWGLGILPRTDAFGRLRNRFLNWYAKNVVLRVPQRQAVEMIGRLTGTDLDVFFTDWVVYADHYAQFTVRGFEYPRRDLPRKFSFVGPVLRSSRWDGELPSWWSDLEQDLPVIHVSQGTVADHDLEELVLPTVRALARSHMLVVVATGGVPVEELGPLPPNARAAEFLPYDELMPKVRVFVTNGGYGGLHYALAHGVPIVVAGETEDKMETSRRVEWSGAGINLRTANPSESQIADAVGRVLNERSFRERAQALRAEIVASPGLPGLERIVLDLVKRRGDEIGR
jgi:UDP:flavonoid glycosyltransferase YjiC (YdhE family)